MTEEQARAKHVSLAELRAMTPAQIVELAASGGAAHLYSPEAVSVDDLYGWRPEDVLSAKAEGRLKHLRIMPDSEESPTSGADQGARGTEGITRKGLRSMSPAEIVAAQERGDLDALMRGEQ
jgi:hypothetical protein